MTPDLPEATRTTPDAPPDAPAAAPVRWWRRFAVAAAVVATIAGLAALLILVAPGIIARFVADEYFAGAGIDVDGVKTIDVDLPEGRITVGPVRFRAAEADPGKLGRLGVNLSLARLFERRALLESVIVEDVDIAIRQAADGEILINGVSLRKILAEEAADAGEPPAEPAPPPPDGERGGGWSPGLDDLEMRNVVVTFTNRDGGTAALRLEQLDLRGFRSWEPDKPGTFQLTGDVNGIDVTASGSARPFADQITIDTEVAFANAEVAKVEEFTGPLGLQRRAGTLGVNARSTVAVFPAGRIEGTTTGSLTLDGADFAREGTGALALAQTRVEYDTRYRVDPGGVTTLEGKVDAALTGATAGLADGLAASFADATLTIPALTLETLADGGLRLSAQPKLDVRQPVVTGPAEVRGESLAVALAALDVETAAGGTLTLKTSGTATLAGLDVAAGGTADTPGSTQVTLAQLSTELTDVSVQSGAGKVNAGGGITVTASGLAATAPGAGGSEPQRVAAESLSLALSNLSADSEGGRAAAKADGSASIGALSVALPAAGDAPAVEARTQTTTLELGEVRFDSGDGRIGVDAGRARAALETIAIGWSEVSRPQAAPAARGARTAAPATTASGRIEAKGLELTLAPLAVRAEGGGATVKTSGAYALSEVGGSVPMPGAPPWAVALRALRLDFADLDLAQRGQETTLAGKLDLGLDGVSATQPSADAAAGAAGETRFGAERLRLSLPRTDVALRGGATAVRTAGAVDLARLAAQLPRTATKPEFQVSLASLRSALEEVGADVGGQNAAPRWRVRLDAQAEQLAGGTAGGELASVKVRTISIGDVRADETLHIAVGRLVVERPETFLTTEYVLGPATAADSRPEQVVQATEEAAKKGATFALGSFGLIDKGLLRVRDNRVGNSTFVVQVNELQVQNVDTRDPGARMTVKLDATINEFSELSVTGWAAPFGATPDFDVGAKLQRLELPPLSDYAAKAVGVNVEGGRLFVDATAAAQAGQLKGEVEVDLRDLSFSTLSAADAERLSATVGVPIETVVGLLEDDEGKIRIDLPVSGDLKNPGFDLSDAIQQAVGGAVQAAVLAPFKLAFAPVSLIASAADGRGVEFQPIPFRTGEAALDTDGAATVDALARILQERDKLNLKVCGRATAADAEAALAEEGAPASGPGRAAALEKLAPRLWSLAGERTANVRRALVDAGAKPRQVAECRILFDAEDTKPARVEVTM